MSKDFNHGMKVSFEGEFGIVVKSELDEPNHCGIIRWDNANEKDFEDWRGQFGIFISLGGKIINQDYEFKFINDSGTLKK